MIEAIEHARWWAEHAEEEAYTQHGVNTGSAKADLCIRMATMWAAVAAIEPRAGQQCGHGRVGCRVCEDDE